ncbi:ester cyclase [Silvimonas amylolytica]|uniref:Ester cyclase n=1 Tax=Silvimonas amylolytica TaxID=449663 RepID=A0ABQ2PKU5_9NEIS|nr:ester cyclase [Silvimonas amylolytica]GGP26248.1 hypothetical protein GCM10010971_20670 [Silvimonas amylolytica]
MQSSTAQLHLEIIMRLPTLLLASSFLAATLSLPALADTNVLPQPHHIAVTDADTSASVILAARRYAAFWNTGDTRYADQALSPDFIDRTLPAGRVQGPQGPRQASAGFRTAVPDLTAEMDDVVVSQDRVSVHLHFKGHFTGQFGNVQGTGQTIDFQAFDLYRVAEGRIVENWHLEDNLTLLQQMGIVKP